MRVLLLCLVTRQYCPAITIGRLNTATQGIIALGEKMLMKASLPVPACAPQRLASSRATT